MIRILRLSLLGLIGLALLVLALANRGSVTLHLLPGDLAGLAGFSWSVEVPLFAVIFGGVILGVLIGFVWEWLRESRLRSEGNSRSREVARLERELAAIKGMGKGPADDVLALLDKH